MEKIDTKVPSLDAINPAVSGRVRIASHIGGLLDWTGIFACRIHVLPEATQLILFRSALSEPEVHRQMLMCMQSAGMLPPRSLGAIVLGVSGVDAAITDKLTFGEAGLVARCIQDALVTAGQPAQGRVPFFVPTALGDRVDVNQYGPN